MIYEIEDASLVAALFDGWSETMIYGCLDRTVGKLYVTDPVAPKAACAFAGCFSFYAGEPEKELLEFRPADFMILTPQNGAWASLIEETLPEARKFTRYAIRKDTRFDREKLAHYAARLPEGYELRRIDGELYERCLRHPMASDFVSTYDSKEHFLNCGRGFVVLKDGEIVAGASSYSSYRNGIEVEVDTAEPERRKGLATVACATLILQCLDDGLYPSWDAANMTSVQLAEKLGYEFWHEYTTYCVG